MTQATAPASTPVAAASLVLKVGSGVFYDGICTASATGYFMLFDAAAVPADGTVSPNLCVAVGANQSVSFSTPADTPVKFFNGCILVFSTTGPFTKTTTTGTAHMSGRVN